MSLIGAECVENLLALIVAQLVEGEFIMVTHEVGPLARHVQTRSLLQGLGDRARITAGERQVDVLHPDEVELHVEPVAVGPAEERQLVLVRQIHLAEQHGVSDAAGDEISDVAEVLTGVEHVRASRHGVLREKERDSIDPEAGDSELEPEPECA